MMKGKGGGGGGGLAVVSGQVTVRGMYSYHHEADLLNTTLQISLMIRRLQSWSGTRLPASSLSAWVITPSHRPFAFYTVVIIIDEPRLMIPKSADILMCTIEHMNISTGGSAVL